MNSPVLSIVTASVFLAASTLSAPVLASDIPELCDRAFARETLDKGAYSEFCGCSKVSNQFLRVIQRADAFEAVLSETGSLCAPLANLLTDPVTASLSSSSADRSDEDRSNGPSSNRSAGRSSDSSSDDRSASASAPSSSPSSSSRSTGTTTDVSGDTSGVTDTSTSGDSGGTGDSGDSGGGLYNGW